MKEDRRPPSRLKVLFADDESALQELMSLELPRLGHEVTVCPDGFTAVAALERNTFDCLIVDLDMPGMTGIQVLTRAKELSPDTEAIILTGKSTLETAVAAPRKAPSTTSRNPAGSPSWTSCSAASRKSGKWPSCVSRCGSGSSGPKETRG